MGNWASNMVVGGGVVTRYHPVMLEVLEGRYTEVFC